MNKILVVLFTILLSACTVSINATPVVGATGKTKNVVEVLDSVCMITVHSKDSDGGLSGSCWAVSDKELISAGHVCDGIIQFQAAGILQDNIFISYMGSGGQLETKEHAEIVEIDAFNDICMLVLKDHGLKPLKLADENPNVNDEVFAVGAPLGVGVLGIYEGKVTSLSSSFGPGYENKMVVSIPGCPGMSGSVVVNNQNEVVGILIAGFSNLTILTPLDKVKRFFVNITG